MSTLVKQTGNYVATVVDHEVLIVDLDGGELFSLSGTAREVWEAIDGSASEADIVAAMAEKHDGKTSVIAADVKALVDDLEKAALVKRQ